MRTRKEPIRKTKKKRRNRPARFKIPKSFVDNFQRFVVIRGTEMARILGVDKYTVYRWCKQEGMPHRIKGKQFTFNLEEVEQWLQYMHSPEREVKVALPEIPIITQEK